jgi:hypothetical protein
MLGRSGTGVRRRDFVRSLSGALVLPYFGAALPNLARAADQGSYPFSEVPASASGITWVHTSGLSPEKYLPQSTGAGCAFLDYDNDGWMDIYLVNSGKCDIFTPTQPLRNALYRNNRDGTFTDVTEKAGVLGSGYGMGVAVGDYNGDGFPDLYVTAYGRSILYRNNGDGTFTDVTERAGVAAPGWASSAVWFDYDNDGKLDLFVCHFVDFDKTKHHNCGAPGLPALKGLNEYCYPRIYSPMPSWLFHNNGDGTFTDVSQKTGIADNPGKAWGVVATDINNDGWMDLFVANDTDPNFLFVNRDGKKFEEIGFTAGVAFGEGGKARSGMGVDSADVNQDGWMDLFVTDLNHEIFGFYLNRHDETFDDIAAQSGIASASKLASGWGLKFFDYDNDGDLDLIIANGHPDDLIEKIYDNVTYREKLMLFHNVGAALAVIPLAGMRRRVDAILITACRPNSSRRPVAASRTKRLGSCSTRESPRRTTKAKSATIKRQARSPSSSPATAKTKSAWASGRKFLTVPSPGPWPQSPPWAKASIERLIW